MVSSITQHELEIVSLYVSDYPRKLHVREIARLLHANHRTIGLTLRQLEKKRIMDSKIAGKNKMFSLNMNNIFTKEYITMAESLQKIKLLEKHFFFKKLLTDLNPPLRTEPLILFGGYAKGLEHKKSDIDLLLITERKEQKIAAKIKELGKVYNKQMHFHQSERDTFEAGLKEKDPLVVEIVNNHIILNNSEFFVELLWRHAHG